MAINTIHFVALVPGVQNHSIQYLLSMKMMYHLGRLHVSCEAVRCMFKCYLLICFCCLLWQYGVIPPLPQLLNMPLRAAACQRCEAEFQRLPGEVRHGAVDLRHEGVQSSKKKESTDGGMKKSGQVMETWLDATAEMLESRKHPLWWMEMSSVDTWYQPWEPLPLFPATMWVR